ncbi:MAG TPA: phosphatase PAP2 family protein [Longimicrobium sp.]|nr:phosphatase PAP2 family protein [Longimicrobium sp.]
MTRRWMAALAGAMLAAAPAGGQTLNAPDTAAQRSPHLFRHRDLLIAGGFVAGAVVMSPLDRALARSLQDSSVQTNRVLSKSANGVRLLGAPGSLIISGGLYAAGRAFGRPHLADTGLHTFESVMMAEAITTLTKGVVGRSRPYASPRDPFDYGFGRGFHGDKHQSMPSGHTSAAFAAAAAGASEIGHWWPRHRTLAAVGLYSAASLVGISRMYNNKHWASDVVVGAGIGAFSGWKVVGYTHAHPNNPVDRLLLGARVAPAGNGGMAIMWSAPTR